MSRLVILALGLAARDRKPSWLSVRSEWTTIFAVSLTCLSSGTLPLVQPKRLEHVRLLPFHAWMARALQLDVLGLPVMAIHQCAWRTASTVVIPAIIEPVIPISAGVPRGNSRLISEARKIAATGRAMTK